MYSSTCICWGSDVGPLWLQGLEATCVSIRCFGRDWNRRGSKEKALRGKAAGGCVRECTCRICRVVGPLSSQGLEGSSVSIGCEIRKTLEGVTKISSGVS